MKTTPTFILALGTFLFIVPVAHKADAAVMYFAAHWSGVPNDNAATATARIGIDTALAPNPGSHVNSAIIPIWFSSITLTISGATSGNGTFTISDFQGMYWNTGGATLDFNMELVGQRTTGEPWGTTNTGTSGDFNVFRADDSLSAPTGTFYFQLTPSRSTNILNLVSFLPIPEPTTTVLFIGGATACLIAARKRRK